MQRFPRTPQGAEAGVERVGHFQRVFALAPVQSQARDQIFELVVEREPHTVAPQPAQRDRRRQRLAEPVFERRDRGPGRMRHGNRSVEKLKHRVAQTTAVGAGDRVAAAGADHLVSLESQRGDRLQLVGFGGVGSLPEDEHEDAFRVDLGRRGGLRVRRRVGRRPGVVAVDQTRVAAEGGLEQSTCCSLVSRPSRQ